MTSLFNAPLKYLPHAVTLIFLVIVLSYYFLLLIKKKKPKPSAFSSITVIIPAHNEGAYINDAISSVLAADFNGLKQIIVVDDGSRDETAKIASLYKPEIALIRTKHRGKSASINTALKNAKGELIAIVDGDSIIHKDSLKNISSELGTNVAACCVVKVKNRNKFICMWLHIEQLYNSLMRYLFSKIHANVTTPGPLSIYRKKELKEVGGFSTESLSEDIDVAIKLIRKGYKIGFAENAVAETNMPSSLKGFLSQRARFARGMLDILKRHMKLNKAIIDIYTLPIFLFTYTQAVIMGLFTIYQIASGYFAYFFSKGVYFNLQVLRFFFEWLSIFGILRWLISVFSGQTPLSLITIAGIVSALLSYPLFLFAIFKFDKKLDIRHLIPIFFMFPFWLLIMLIYVICLTAVAKSQYNIWKKNE